MEERSRPGKGFSFADAAAGAGAGVCWASAQGARTRQNEGCDYVSQRARLEAVCFAAWWLDVSLMRCFSVRKRFVEQMARVE